MQTIALKYTNTMFAIKGTQMKKTVGLMIKETSIERNISLSALGRGLCTKSDLSRYLNGTRRIDRLLLTVLLQRIGKSPAKFSLLLTEGEYAYFEWKHKICLAQMSGNWEQLEQMLQQNERTGFFCNEVLERQYAKIMLAIVTDKVYHDRARSVILLQEAISMTVPNFQNGIKPDDLLGTQEICAILLWQNLQSDKEKALKILKELILHLETHYQDVQELIKVYPKVAMQYLRLLQEKKEYENCLVLSEKVLRLMIETGYASHMEYFLQTYVAVARRLGVNEKVEKREKQLDAWRELMKEIGHKEKSADDELFLMDVWQEIELLHEAISVSRRERKYSQEKLSENICEPETISRIENGKNVPHKKIYKELAKKLCLPEECYFTTIETDNFEVLELQWRLETLIMRRQWSEAEAILNQLKDMLNIGDKRNLQYIGEMQYSIKKGQGRIPVEERLQQLMYLLQYTMPDAVEGCWSSGEFWEHYFKKTEISILIKVADVLSVTNQKERAANLLEAILQYYKKNKLYYDLHYRIVALVVARLTSVYSDLLNYERVLSYVEEGVLILETCGNQRLLGGIINNKAYALERLGQKEASLKYYRLAYYCADLMELSSAEKSKCAYERIVGRQIEWY